MLLSNAKFSGLEPAAGLQKMPPAKEQDGHEVARGLWNVAHNVRL